jgi:opacity protein-like surface antigen
VKKLFMSMAVAASAAAMPTLAANNCDPCCNNSFEGLYVGGTIGVGSHNGEACVDNSFVGGVQLGYDVLLDNLVVGAVADWNFSNHNTSHSDGWDNYRQKLDWTSTIRLRLGVPVCDSLIYLTGGGIVGKFKHRRDADYYSSSSHNDSYRWGWVGGVGLEHKFCNNLSFGAELLYAHFNNKKSHGGGCCYENNSSGHCGTEYVGRLILNYRFGDLCNLW